MCQLNLRGLLFHAFIRLDSGSQTRDNQIKLPCCLSVFLIPNEVSTTIDTVLLATESQRARLHVSGCGVQKLHVATAGQAACAL